MKTETVQVCFRLQQALVKRMRAITQKSVWPPPPTQTEIVERGIELVLNKLEREKRDA